MTSILILAVNAICRHLITGAVHHDSYCAVLDAGVDGSAKQCLYLFRPCGSSNIPVAGFASKQGVTHTAAYRKGLVAVAV